MSKLNEKLRVLLKNYEWTQAKLADRMHVSPDAVSSWIRGKNHLSIETAKELCDIFCINVQDFLNDDFEIPEFIVIDKYLPDSMNNYPKRFRDSEHTIIDADLAYEGKLHRFTNAKGVKCSAIYRAKKEIWWHYREFEPAMIRDWNEVHKSD